MCLTKFACTFNRVTMKLTFHKLCKSNWAESIPRFSRKPQHLGIKIYFPATELRSKIDFMDWGVTVREREKITTPPPNSIFLLTSYSAVPIIWTPGTGYEANLASCQLKFTGKNFRQIYRKSIASVWRNLSTVFVSRILCCVAQVYKSFFFFSEKPFYETYSTLDSHSYTVIFYVVAY